MTNNLLGKVKALNPTQDITKTKIGDFIGVCEQAKYNDVQTRRLLFEHFDTTDEQLKSIYESDGITKVLDSERLKYKIENLGIRKAIYEFWKLGNQELNQTLMEFDKTTEFVGEHTVVGKFINELNKYTNSDLVRTGLTEIYENTKAVEDYIVLNNALVGLKAQSLEENAPAITMIEKCFENQVGIDKMNALLLNELHPFTEKNPFLKSLAEKALTVDVPTSFNALVEFILVNEDDQRVNDIIEDVVKTANLLENDTDKVDVLVNRLRKVENPTAMTENILSKFNGQFTKTPDEQHMNSVANKEVNETIETIEKSTSNLLVKEKLQELKSLVRMGLKESQIRSILVKELGQFDDDESIKDFIAYEQRKYQVEDMKIADAVSVMLEDESVQKDSELRQKLHEIQAWKQQGYPDYLIAEHFNKELNQWRYNNAVSNQIERINRTFDTIKPYALCAKTIFELQNSKQAMMYGTIIEKLNRVYYMPEYMVRDYVVMELAKWQHDVPQVANLIQQLKFVNSEQGTTVSTHPVFKRLSRLDLIGESESQTHRVKSLYSIVTEKDNNIVFYADPNFYAFNDEGKVIRVDESSLSGHFVKTAKALAQNYVVTEAGVQTYVGNDKVSLVREFVAFPPVKKVMNTFDVNEANVIASENFESTGKLNFIGGDEKLAKVLAEKLHNKYEADYAVTYMPESREIAFTAIEGDNPTPYMNVIPKVNESALDVVDSHDFAQKIRYMLSAPNEKVNELMDVYDEFENLIECDFVSRIESKLHEGLLVDLIIKESDVYVARVNPIMQENIFEKVTAPKAVEMVKEAMNIDISRALSDLLEGVEKIKSQMENERDDIAQRIQIIEGQLDRIASEDTDVQANQQIKNIKMNLDQELVKLREQYKELDSRIRNEEFGENTNEDINLNVGDTVKVKSLDNQTGTVNNIRSSDGVITVLMDDGDTKEISYEDLDKVDVEDMKGDDEKKVDGGDVKDNEPDEKDGGLKEAKNTTYGQSINERYGDTGEVKKKPSRIVINSLSEMKQYSLKKAMVSESFNPNSTYDEFVANIPIQIIIESDGVDVPLVGVAQNSKISGEWFIGENISINASVIHQTMIKESKDLDMDTADQNAHKSILKKGENVANELDDFIATLDSYGKVNADDVKKFKAKLTDMLQTLSDN